LSSTMAPAIQPRTNTSAHSYWLDQQGRLTHPMVYDARTDRYESVTWEAAFQMSQGHQLCRAK
jgi:anaerobic selenocysteine-containing dehydrogenase